MPDDAAFIQSAADPARGVARGVASEIYASCTYTKLVELLTEAEAVFCKAAQRESGRARRGHGYRENYKPEELFAERLIDLLGTPQYAALEIVEQITGFEVERERGVAA